MSATIKVTENLSEVHEHSLMNRKLWLTPGSNNPYWSTNANFMYDEVVATPFTFLDEAGYDSFDDEADYDEADESITIKVELIPYVE